MIYNYGLHHTLAAKQITNKQNNKHNYQACFCPWPIWKDETRGETTFHRTTTWDTKDVAFDSAHWNQFDEGGSCHRLLLVVGLRCSPAGLVGDAQSTEAQSSQEQYDVSGMN